MASTDASPQPKKNTAFRVYFPIYDNTGALVSGAAGLDSEVSKDGGNYADCTNEATEIQSTGTYWLDLTSGEMNADAVVLIVKTSTSDAKTSVLVFYPQEAGDVKVDVETWKGSTAPAMTGDAFARLGAPAGASVSADVAAVKSDTAEILVDTNELQTDWVNGGRLDLIVDAILADTNELQTDWANGGRLDLLIDAILADTNELQTDWVNGGRLDLLLDSVVAAVAASAIRAAVGLASANLDTQLSTIDTVVDAIKAVTDADGGANAIETGISKLQALRAILSAMVGVATGGSSTSIVLKNPAGDTTRATLTVDADGNRSASVLNL